ncbi:MAG: HlyD family efflux transporter periplasmic adaptor subunit [Planctomycetota bacterium]|nr:HlyD family efflux transporter periplasmic adaptor subunit [Planctomycetota bacterium]
MTPDDNVNQVRERVLQLAREIERLSQSDLPPEGFFQQFLNHLVGALGAKAGAVWMMEGSMRLTLLCELRLEETGFHENPMAQRVNERLLTNVLQTGEASTHSPNDGGDTQLPTQHMLILGGLSANKVCVGVVQLFQRPDAPDEARPGYLQFVEQMSGYASKYLEKRTKKVAPTAGSQFWNDFEQYTLQMQRSLDVNEVASAAASDGRLLLGCDRLSVAVRRGNKTSISAISGQDSVNPRANLVRTMAELAKTVISTREPLVYSGKVDKFAPQVEKPLANYIQESGSRMVLVIPFLESEALLQKDDEGGKKNIKPRLATGCLIVEQVAESQPVAGLEERAEMLADHVGAAINNSIKHGRIFGLSVWKFLGHILEWFHGRKLAKTLAILGVIAVIIGAMVFVPWDYRVEGQGKLMPIEQYDVFAPWNGTVESLLDPEGNPLPAGQNLDGKRVIAGQPLIRLRDKELDKERNEYEGEMEEKRKLIEVTRIKIDRSQDQAERIELQGQMQAARLRVINLQETLKIIDSRIESLTVRAPHAGVITNFQTEQLLSNRPVNRGELLLEIMDDSGDWRLEVEVEEQRMGHLRRAQIAQKNDSLPVEFILATDSESTYSGVLGELSTRASTSQNENKNVMQVFVTINRDDLPETRIGAEVRTKINCGKRSLGYVLFGDVVEFLQKRFIVWL